LQNLPEKNGSLIPGFQDRRVDEGKLRNWQRRYRGVGKEMPTVSRREDENRGWYTFFTETHSGERTILPADIDNLGDVSKAGFEMAEAALRQESVLCKDLHAASNLGMNKGKVVQQAKSKSEGIEAMGIVQDPWPFDWTTVDIPGSPGLSRLFKRLEIEAVHVPAFSLDASESGDPTCLSQMEIQEVFNGRQTTATKEFHEAQSSRVQTFHGPSEGCPAGQAPLLPWRNNTDVFCGYSESPLREIYVFPFASQQKVSPKSPTSKMAHWTQCQTQEAEVESKYTKLKMHFPADHPAVIEVMKELALTLCWLRKYKRAESLYRELVDIYRQNRGPNNLDTLHACHNVVDTLRQQGHFSKAKALNDNLRSAASKLVQANHPLAIDVANSDAWLAELLGHRENAENVRREILQILLTTHGPRHFNSMRALSCLGNLISRKGSEGGEMLLRTALQLSLEDPESDSFCYAAIFTMRDLANALYSRGDPEESLRIASGAVERFGPLLGANHPCILELETSRAWSLLRSGNLDESEKLFGNLAALHSVEKEEEDRRNLVRAWLGLAHVCSRRGDFEHAIGWYEKCFGLGIPVYGTYPNALVGASYQLADWYENHRLFVDALRVYQRLISEIREYGDDHEMIAKLGSEVRRIEDRVQRDARSASDISEYESESDDTDWSTDDATDERVDEEIEVGMEMDQIEEDGRGQENEDWKSFDEAFKTP
jgi:tetratricopeptide (TPR) repeat protein